MRFRWISFRRRYAVLSGRALKLRGRQSQMHGLILLPLYWLLEPSRHTEEAVLGLISGESLTGREAVRRYADDLRQDLFASAAAQAQVDVADTRVAQREAAGLQCAHDIDASAGRIVLVA
jgi:hypothetical protein